MIFLVVYNTNDSSTLVSFESRLVNHQPSMFDIYCHISQHERDSLMFRNRHTKGLALPCIFRRFVQATPGQTQSTGSNLYTYVKLWPDKKISFHFEHENNELQIPQFSRPYIKTM